MSRSAGSPVRRSDDEDVLVELVDATADAPEPEAEAPDDGVAVTHEDPEAAAATRAAARRRPRPAALVAVAVVALVLTAGGVLQARSEAALAARIASVPGAVADLSHPLEVTWEVADAWPLGAREDVVVLQTGRGALQGVDLRTGEVVWRDDTVAERCIPVDVTGRGWMHQSAHLVCGPVAPAPGESVRVTIRDPATGAALGTVDGTGHLLDVVVHDGVVLVVLASGNELRAVAWDPRTAELEDRWRWEGDEEDRYDGGETLVQVVEGALVVSRWNMEQTDPDDMVTPLVAVDLDTGDPVDPPAESTMWTWQVPVGDGLRAVTRLTADGPAVRLVRDDGTVVGEHPGELWIAPVDDGTGDVVLLRLGSQVRALETATGAERWVNPDVKDTPFARVDGVLVAGDGSGISGYDVATGAELWTVDETSHGYYAPTDGRRVLVQTYGPDGPEMTALDVHDGREVWSVELDQEAEVVPVGGHVLLLRSDGTVLGTA